MFKVLVVEDDKNLRKLITTYLKRNGYITYEATNGVEALDLMDTKYVDLIISDIMMQEMDGYELTKSLRDANYTIPILLVTAKSTIADKKEGFLLGADDYMVKPINMEELLLRVKVLLKRANVANETKLIIGNMIIDYKQMSISYKGQNYQLAQKEFQLLYKLLSTPDTIFTRQELMEEIWGLESESDYRTVDVHIKRIREKLKDINEFEIITIRGIGYKAVINKRNKEDDKKNI